MVISEYDQSLKSSHSCCYGAFVSLSNPDSELLTVTSTKQSTGLEVWMCTHVQAASLMKLRGGDVSRVIADAMTHVVSIYAPTFFSSNTNLFQENIAALQFGFAGISVAPCAIPITPIGIGIFPAVWCRDCHIVTFLYSACLILAGVIYPGAAVR